MSISFAEGKAEFSIKGIISLGPYEKKGFKIKFEVKTNCQDKDIKSSRITFIPDLESMGGHEIASSVLYSKILDKLREITPKVIPGVNFIEEETLLTFELIGAEPFSGKDLMYYVTGFSDALHIKLQQIESKMEDAFNIYGGPSGYTG